MPSHKLNRKCEQAECNNPHHARGLCMKHYTKTDFRRESNKQYRKRNPLRVKEWHRKHDKIYRQRHPEEIKALSRRRRGQRTAGLKKYGWINVRLVSNYYTKICGICETKIESKYELDHIIPLSRNGTHTLDNLQLTHPICNRTKHNRLQKDMKLDIMLLRELIL